MRKILFNSFVLLIFALSSFVFQITSCKKATAQTTSLSYPIQGLWIGTYTVDGQSSVGEQYFSFIIKPDGTIIADTKWGTQQHLAIGTWTLTGSTFNCSFTCVYGSQSNIGVTETSSASWDKAGKLVGNWKNTPPNSGTGNITLNRIN